MLTLPDQPDHFPPRKSLIHKLRSTVGYPGLLDRVGRTQNPDLRGVYLEAYLGIAGGIPLYSGAEPETEPEWKSELKSLPPKIREEAEQFLRDHPDMRWGG